MEGKQKGNKHVGGTDFSCKCPIQRVSIGPQQTVCRDVKVWGGLRTQAFPYEPGFVLCDKVGDCDASGELVSSSSGELLYMMGETRGRWRGVRR